MTEIAEVKAQ